MKKAIYKTGSSLLLKNSNDNDFVFFYETKEEARQALIEFKRDYDGCVHFDYVRPLKVFLGCYIYHFMELVEGEDLHLDEFSIFDHEEEYKELLKKFVNLPKESKNWYHILTAYYMFKNNSYELTESQLKDIQRAHDKGITNAKYNLCIEWLGVVS